MTDKHLLANRHQWRLAMVRSGLPASGFEVGLVLADLFINVRTGRCFPSFERIAEACGTSVRKVRSGVDALRSAGLIETKKTKFDGSLSFTLCLPKRLRSDEILSLREDLRSDRNPSHEVTEKGHRSDGNPSLNLRKEPGHITIEGESSSCGPAGDSVAIAPSVYRSDRSIDPPASYERALEHRRDLFSKGTEEELAIDESRLGDVGYLWTWLNLHCPSKQEYPAIIALARKGELSVHHLRRIAS